MVEKFQPSLALSVVVVVFNMDRQAARTLHSLSAAYQRYIGADAYEVIVVDNGSDPPFNPGIIDGLPGDFRLIRIDDATCYARREVIVGLDQAARERLDLIHRLDAEVKRLQSLQAG